MKQVILAALMLLSVNCKAQNVNIPDINFKAYLVGNILINTNADAEIQVTEATAFTGTINCSNQGISDLTGIEAFTALTILDCYANLLTWIDLSQNAALTELNCYSNQLTSLDVSHNTALTYLYCIYNQLTSLDVSMNTDLTLLYCVANQITSLDLSQNIALTDLYCAVNPITSLDVSMNTALNYLNCDSCYLTCLNVKNGINSSMWIFSAKDNQNLTCIEVDNVAWSTANWTDIDTQTSFSTNCANSCSTVGINEHANITKQLLKIVDLMGRQTTYKPNTVLICLYSDGTTQRVFEVE